MESFEERMARRQTHYKRRLDYVIHKLKYMPTSLEESNKTTTTKSTHDKKHPKVKTQEKDERSGKQELAVGDNLGDEKNKTLSRSAQVSMDTGSKTQSSSKQHGNTPSAPPTIQTQENAKGNRSNIRPSHMKKKTSRQCKDCKLLQKRIEKLEKDMKIIKRKLKNK